MKQKLPMIIAGIIIVVALIIGIAYATGAKKKNEESKDVNVQEVSKSISEKTPFSEIMAVDITKTELEDVFQVNPENVEEVAGKFPMMNVHASMYVLIKAKDGKVDDVKSELNAYAESYEEMWSMYLPEQYDLVKAREFGNVGNCVYLIISENAKELKDLVK